ncbi:MAG: hypothetical protein ACI8WM_002464 [Burkholderiaceae bacterium]|jgi:hypothetical protein
MHFGCRLLRHALELINKVVLRSDVVQMASQLKMTGQRTERSFFVLKRWPPSRHYLW